MIDMNTIKKYSSDLKRRLVRARRMRMSAAPNIDAYRRGTLNSMFTDPGHMLVVVLGRDNLSPGAAETGIHPSILSRPQYPMRDGVAARPAMDRKLLRGNWWRRGRLERPT